MPTTLSREPHRSRQFWIDHVQRWQDSGLSKAAYCERHNIKPGSFYNWSIKIGKLSSADTDVHQTQNVEPTQVQFHSVKLTPDNTLGAQFVHVERAATEVALPANLTPEQIHHWLSIIHQLHV
jgi:hypothetical protein